MFFKGKSLVPLEEYPKCVFYHVPSNPMGSKKGCNKGGRFGEQTAFPKLSTVPWAHFGVDDFSPSIFPSLGGDRFISQNWPNFIRSTVPKYALLPVSPAKSHGSLVWRLGPKGLQHMFSCWKKQLTTTYSSHMVVYTSREVKQKSAQKANKDLVASNWHHFAELIPLFATQTRMLFLIQSRQ